MRRLTPAVAAGCAALLLGSVAVPAAAQDQTGPAVAGAVNRYQDPTTVTRMRPIPSSGFAAALVSTQVEGYSPAAIAAFQAVPSIVVAPAGMTQGEKDEFSRTFRATPDGYFARLTRDGYDVVINGTLAYSVAPESLRLQRRTGRYHVQKSEGETGIAFSDFGGDYLIQFICQQYVEDQIGGCVSDEEAVALFERIVPLGGGLD